MPPPNLRYVTVASLSIALLTACSDAPTPPTDESPVTGPMLRSSAGLRVAQSRMDSLLAFLTREVAVALAAQPVRQDVLAALHASPFRENKLHFRTFLSSDGHRIFEALSGSLGGAVRVVGVLDSLIDLEFYMPVDQHRETWAGGADVMVGSVMDDDGSTPHFFDISGQPVDVPLWESSLPETPTLSLVPVETDFSRPPASVAVSGASTASDPGVYMVRADIFDSDGYEPSLKGDPEFETHVFARNAAGTFLDAQCAGQDQTVPFRYDHNDDAENPWEEEVTLILEGGIGTNPVQFSVWENDQAVPVAAGPCISSGGRPPEVDDGIIDNYNAWGARNVTAVTSSGGTKLIRIESHPIGIDLADNEAPDDDDEVGEVRPTSCWPTEQGPVRFDLRLSEAGHPLTGKVDLDFRFGQRDPICPPPPMIVEIRGPTSAPEFSSVTVRADVSNATAPLSYAWKKNGSPTCGNSSSCSGQIGAAGTQTTFQVTVTDADQDTGSDSHTVSAEFNECTDCLAPSRDTTGVERVVLPPRKRPEEAPPREKP